MRTETADTLGHQRQRILLQIVQLDHAPLPDKLCVPMPGVIGAPEGQKGTAQGGNLCGKILQVVPGAQQPQSAVLVRPLFVEIDQHGDHLALVIGVNITVGPFTVFTHGDRRGHGRQIHAELLTQRFGEGRLLQLLHEAGKGRPAGEPAESVVRRGGNIRVIPVHLRQHLGIQKTRYHQEIEGVSLQFLLVQGL